MPKRALALLLLTPTLLVLLASSVLAHAGYCGHGTDWHLTYKVVYRSSYSDARGWHMHKVERYDFRTRRWVKQAPIVCS